MYIRRKTQKRKGGWTVDYYYACESYREGGKVKQRTVVYIGPEPDIDKAITEAEARLDWLKRSGRVSAKYLPGAERRLTLLLEARDKL